MLRNQGSQWVAKLNCILGYNFEITVSRRTKNKKKKDSFCGSISVSLALLDWFWPDQLCLDPLDLTRRFRVIESSMTQWLNDWVIMTQLLYLWFYLADFGQTNFVLTLLTLWGDSESLGHFESFMTRFFFWIPDFTVMIKLIKCFWLFYFFHFYIILVFFLVTSSGRRYSTFTCLFSLSAAFFLELKL